MNKLEVKITILRQREKALIEYVVELDQVYDELSPFYVAVQQRYLLLFLLLL